VSAFFTVVLAMFHVCEKVLAVAPVGAVAFAFLHCLDCVCQCVVAFATCMLIMLAHVHRSDNEEGDGCDTDEERRKMQRRRGHGPATKHCVDNDGKSRKLKHREQVIVSALAVLHCSCCFACACLSCVSFSVFSMHDC